MDRKSARDPSLPTDADGSSVTYGVYFSAARNCLMHDNMAILKKAARHQLGRHLSARAIQSLHIHLAKHGAFYHPARVTLTADSADKVQLVLNVAASPEGRSILADEVSNLLRLKQTRGGEFIPRVYGSWSHQEGEGPPLEMFAAQWLDGFFEFHLSRESGWVLWDDEHGPRPLSAAQADEIYRQAASILTCCYNPLTFESIARWHHAAGDFVVRQSDEALQVRLISVRRYAPFLEPDAKAVLSLESILDGFCLFLLDMSLRMRLDRFDGTGQMACSPARCVEPVWKGFRQGIDILCRQHGLPLDFRQGVLDYLNAHSQRELVRLGRRVLDRYPVGTEETGLLLDALEDHVAALTAAMATANEHPAPG